VCEESGTDRSFEIMTLREVDTITQAVAEATSRDELGGRE
jgi:hypothetical protein